MQDGRRCEVKEKNGNKGRDEYQEEGNSIKLDDQE